MYSIIYEDKVLDFHYYKGGGNNNMYNFYIGDIFIGQIFKRRKHSWHAVSFHKNSQDKETRHMGGFGCRDYAAEFLLKVNGFRKDPEEEKERKASQERVQQIKDMFHL